MKKILVTGGAGFIGSNLISSLKKNNNEIYSLDDYTSGSKKNQVNGVKYYKLDIEEIARINQRFDVCYHLAAKTLVQESFIKPEEYFRVNVKGTLKLLEWARGTNMKIVYAGSASRHSDPSSSPYALTKFFGEEICSLYKKNFDINVQIARFYNVYGPYEKVHELNGNVIGIWRAKQMKKKQLLIVGDGNQKRDFIHVNDLVMGLIKISNFKENKNIEWELGSGVQYSINELFDFFKNRFPEVDSLNVDDQPGNFRSSNNITEKNKNDLKKLINWEPKDRLKEYIQNLD